jgi:hypothetical protein
MAKRLEVFPVTKDRWDDFVELALRSLWWGAESMYDRTGFKEVVRWKKTRPVVRRRLRSRASDGERTTLRNPDGRERVLTPP